MPNKRSAAKRVLQSERRRLRNTAAKSEIKTIIKKTRAAIAAGDSAAAKQLAAEAESRLAKAAKKGIVHVNNARRRAARLHRAADQTAGAE